MDNLGCSSCSYRIASEELYETLTDGEERGAEPSKLDLELASFPEVSYVVYSVRDRKIESYIWTDGRFRNKRIRISKLKNMSR